MEEQEGSEDHPLIYALDNVILMHRDAHFSGNFALMLDYYRKEGRGVISDIEISRIEELYEMELNQGVNLAAMLLSGSEMEKIARAKQLYKQLRDLYNVDAKIKSIPLLIAELILAENEDVDAAIQAVVAEKGNITSALIDLLRSEEFHDPLFPGYGQAATLASECLGLIGDKRAIISLFEEIGSEDFFGEECVLKALHAIGLPAKIFLLNVLKSRPLNDDNERAAIALVKFKDDPEVSEASLKLLNEIDLRQNQVFASYLVFVCEGLVDSDQRQQLLALAEKESTPKMLKADIKAMAKTWL